MNEAIVQAVELATVLSARAIAASRLASAHLTLRLLEELEEEDWGQTLDQLTAAADELVPNDEDDDPRSAELQAQADQIGVSVDELTRAGRARYLLLELMDIQPEFDDPDSFVGALVRDGFITGISVSGDMRSLPTRGESALYIFESPLAPITVAWEARQQAASDGSDADDALLDLATLSRNAPPAVLAAAAERLRCDEQAAGNLLEQAAMLLTLSQLLRDPVADASA